VSTWHGMVCLEVRSCVRVCLRSRLRLHLHSCSCTCTTTTRIAHVFAQQRARAESVLVHVGS
jgi:hypothetical protein